nr:inositol monophosphatase family protein [Caballeronia sp. AZ7_KS35]
MRPSAGFAQNARRSAWRGFCGWVRASNWRIAVTPTDIERFLDQLGDEARAIAMQYFRTKIDVESKADSTPVTHADRAIERRLRDLVAARFPSLMLVGEEGGGRSADGISWVIDPIDGTKSFVTGLPLFGTLVAMLENRRPVCGMIEVSAMRERWIGGVGHTLCNGKPCTVSTCAHLRDARLCSTDPRMFSGDAERAFARLAREVRVTRFGTDCYGYAMLASKPGSSLICASLGMKCQRETPGPVGLRLPTCTERGV